MNIVKFALFQKYLGFPAFPCQGHGPILQYAFKHLTNTTNVFDCYAFKIIIICFWIHLFLHFPSELMPSHWLTYYKHHCARAHSCITPVLKRAHINALLAPVWVMFAKNYSAQLLKEITSQTGPLFVSHFERCTSLKRTNGPLYTGTSESIEWWTIMRSFDWEKHIE